MSAGAAAGGFLGAAGAGLSSLGKERSANKYNSYLNNMYSVQNGPLLARAALLNPYLTNALKGDYGSTNFQRDFTNIAQGRDISPYLLNQPLNQLNRGYASNMSKMQSLLGRSNMSGGLANAYALANMGGRNNAISNLYNQYGQWREGQRRADLNWLMGQYNNNLGMSLDMINRQMGLYQNPPNRTERAGNMLTGFLTGASGGFLGGGGGAQTAPQPTYNMAPSYNPNPYVNSLGSTGSWYRGWGN